MKLSRIMKVTEIELRNIINTSKWVFEQYTSWSGEECKETFDVGDHHQGMLVIVNYECNDNEIERPENWDKFEEVKRLINEDEEIPEELEEFQDDAKCYEDLDEYLNNKKWILQLKDVDEIKELGFETWLELQDTGYIEINLI